TKSFALLLFDPEGRPRAGVSPMVIYGIPAEVKGFAEGELSKPSDIFVGGKNLMGVGIYFGPGTPPNTDWHHYTFTLVATDLDPKALEPGMTREELAAALKDHVKGSAGLATRFRPPSWGPGDRGAEGRGCPTTSGSARECRARGARVWVRCRGPPRQDRH